MHYLGHVISTAWQPEEDWAVYRSLLSRALVKKVFTQAHQEHGHQGLERTRCALLTATWDVQWVGKPVSNVKSGIAFSLLSVVYEPRIGSIICCLWCRRSRCCMPLLIIPLVSHHFSLCSDWNRSSQLTFCWAEFRTQWQRMSMSNRNNRLGCWWLLRGPETEKESLQITEMQDDVFGVGWSNLVSRPVSGYHNIPLCIATCAFCWFCFETCCNQYCYL